MKIINLKKVSHNKKVGDSSEEIEPNIIEDSIFLENGEPIGFYIKDISKSNDKIFKISEICNFEFLSDRVPKSLMARSSKLTGNGVSQFSTIIGGCPAKPNFRRNYPTISSVHNVKSSEKFILSMILLSKEIEKIIKELLPKVYEFQKNEISKLEKKWRLTELFTSSISNFNISADFHRDNANINGTVNIILVKKKSATGGNTTVPDYGATVDSCNNSILVYPAWKNLHAVTPIKPTANGGYRNSLVFYPLNGFPHGKTTP